MIQNDLERGAWLKLVRAAAALDRLSGGNHDTELALLIISPRRHLALLTIPVRQNMARFAPRQLATF